jgi:hypothetical protein
MAKPQSLDEVIGRKAAESAKQVGNTATIAEIPIEVPYAPNQPL